MGDGAEKLKAVALLLQGKVRLAGSYELDLRALDLELLSFARTLLDDPTHTHGSAGGHVADHAEGIHTFIAHSLESEAT